MVWNSIKLVKLYLFGRIIVNAETYCIWPLGGWSWVGGR
jgi:hypothetical protein